MFICLTLALRRYNYLFIRILKTDPSISVSKKNSCSKKFQKPSSKTSAVESSILTGLPRNFNYLQETFAGESVSSIAIGGKLDSSNWLKGTPKRRFFWKFPETFKIAVFSKYLLKNLWLNLWHFEECVDSRLQSCYLSKMTSKFFKDLFLALLEHSQETFFVESLFVRNSGL